MSNDRSITAMSGPQELAHGPEMELLKADRRSRVWVTEVGGRRWVIKRFGHSRLKQWVTFAAGLHPGQRERRAARRLEREGLPVVPVVGLGWMDGRVWVATPFAGDSVQRHAMAGRFGDAAFRRLVMPQLADLVTTLATHGWFFRDLQLANLVLDGDTVRLIDVGSIRRLSGPRQVHRMIAMLVRSLHIDGAGLRNMARLTGLAVGRPLRDHRMMLEYLRSLAPLEDPRS